MQLVVIVRNLLQFSDEKWLPLKSKPVRYVEWGMVFDFRDLSEWLRQRKSGNERK